MAGGRLKDALDEADINLGASARTDSPRPEDSHVPPKQIIMIRCASCGTLNEEESKFCQECGRKI